jgi:hypothetical protein
MEIYTSFESGNKCLVFFKAREDCKSFINYLTSLDVKTIVQLGESKEYSSYLSNSPIIEDWPIIYPKYVLKEDVDNFIKLMED